MTKPPYRVERDLPYAVAKSALGELVRLLEDADNVDESLLDLAWLGLERPNPEPRNTSTHVVVMLTKTQSEALRALIDGRDVNARTIDRARVRLNGMFVL
jgi:hypothetical protein